MLSRSLTGSVSLALLVVVAAAGVLAAAGSARAPGNNGPIAFRRYFDEQQTWGAVFTVQPNGTQARQLTHPARGILDDQPAWAPDGRVIAFTRCLPNEGACHVWTVAADGSGPAPVGKLCPAGANEQPCPDEAHAAFSPDSKRLVLVQSTGAEKQVPITGQQIEHSAIAVMNRDGSGPRVIYTTNGFTADLDYPVFSPNGKWIIYHSHLDDPTGQSQYFLVHPDGTGRKQITHFANGTHIASASFSPDGTSIVFSKGPERGNIDVFTMRLNGRQLRRLTRSKLWDSAPDWGPA